MSEQSNLPDQHQLLSAVNTLLATVQQPLGALAETLQAPEQLLAELTPSLAVVAFSPFAQLVVPVAEPHQSIPKAPLRPSGAPPVATAVGAAASPVPSSPPLALTQPITGQQISPTNDPTKTRTPPVFSLPNQKHSTTVGASPTGRPDASPDHSLAQWIGTQATPVIGSAMDTADRNAPLSEQWHREQASIPAVAQMSLEQTRQPENLPIGSEAIGAEPSLATMPLLAAVVDRLLATPTARAEPVATQEASATGALAVPTAPVAPSDSGWSWPVSPRTGARSIMPTNDSNRLSAQQLPLATTPIQMPAADPATMLTGWPNVAGENPRTNGVPSGATNQPPLDAWALAQLVNDVLAEEARRHGVDLS